MERQRSTGASCESFGLSRATLNSCNAVWLWRAPDFERPGANGFAGSRISESRCASETLVGCWKRVQGPRLVPAQKSDPRAHTRSLELSRCFVSFVSFSGSHYRPVRRGSLSLPGGPFHRPKKWEVELCLA